MDCQGCDLSAVIESAPSLTRQEANRIVVLYNRKAQRDKTFLDFMESRFRKGGHSVFIDIHLEIGVDWAPNST